MRILILAALANGAIAAPALAQDAAPFSGFRVEAIAGYDAAEGAEMLDFVHFDLDGITYGVAIGYDFQAGNVVAGVEAEATDTSIRQCYDAVAIAGDELCAEGGRDLYVGGRVGTALSSNALLYAKAGYSNARVQTRYSGPNLGPVIENDNLDGIRIGGGVEFSVASNAFLKTENRYSNYEAGFERHQVVAGAGFRF